MVMCALSKSAHARNRLYAAGAAYVIPMHFSPRYMGEIVAMLRAEVAAAFGGNVL